MRKIIALLLFSAATCSAQSLTGKAGWTNNFGNLSACPSGITTNCVLSTTVTDTTINPPALLCTGAGAATSCSGTVDPLKFPALTTHTWSYSVQYYGSTAGTLLTGPAETIQVTNSVIQAPGAPSGLTGSVQ